MSLTHDPVVTRMIIGLAMRVHTRLGPGLPGSAYEWCLCYDLDRNGLPYARHGGLPLVYEELVIENCYRADLIVRGEVLLELKAGEAIHRLHEAQRLTYLRLSGCEVALLLNFNTLSLNDGIGRRTL